SAGSRLLPDAEISTLTLTESRLQEVWQRLLVDLSHKSPILASQVKSANSYAIFGPNALAIRFTAEYTHHYQACAGEANTRRIQETLTALLGGPAQVRFECVAAMASGTQPLPNPSGSSNGTTDRKKHLMTLPLFQKASQALGAQIWHVDDDFNPAAPPRGANTTSTSDFETDADPTPEEN
ncbi:MAG: hypothetical protein U0792_23710, partial [Gemmataceae bacterium]